ncbi:membrane protein [Mycolicibacter hiberniae]|uniref:Membrane protein n=2 Tax=Mycolicibacter hiberniae TaxID=29314 RepID=A0A7I7WYE0_9MYCO|nr:membrane protein [Mycolicibacter hiberniae]
MVSAPIVPPPEAGAVTTPDSIGDHGTYLTMTDTKPDRYRDTQRSTLPRKLLAITLGALAIATAAALAVVGYQRFATAEVKGDLYGYEVLDDQTVSVKFSVTRSDPSRPAACIVRVRSSDGSETGRREILVPPSESATVQVTTTVKSSQPPVMGDVYGCGSDVPDYLRLP